ncbi:MAG: ribonuclease Y [bacterium]
MGIIQGIAAGFAAGAFIVYIIYRAALKNKKSALMKDAVEEALKLKENAVKDEEFKFQKLSAEMRKSYEDKEASLKASSNNIQQKSEFIRRQEQELAQKRKAVSGQMEDIARKGRLLKMKEEEIAKKSLGQKSSLESVSQMSQAEAKKMLVSSMEDEARADAQKLIADIIRQAEEDAQVKARKIIATAIQKSATEEVQSLATTVVQLPNDDMKGRIIGKEGRNIKAFEAATGVELIVDDTPGIITLSSFDGVRRYIGQLTIERLIADGRIHPGRIEELSKKAEEDVALRIKEIGADAVQESGVTGLKNELVDILGRMEFRFSYKQNILRHSLEVSKIAKFIAYELGGDADTAARAGLLHDIGKAVSGEVDGSHAVLGADILQKNGEKDIIINAVKAHHEEVPFESLEAVLVSVADTLSATRPGARMESVEHYFKRIKKIEEIAMLFDGVEKAFAISAGREVRVIVQPEKVSETNAPVLAREIAQKIAREVEYPGQLKVSLIREQRWNELA